MSTEDKVHRLADLVAILDAVQADPRTITIGVRSVCVQDVSERQARDALGLWHVTGDLVTVRDNRDDVPSGPFRTITGHHVTFFVTPESDPGLVERMDHDAELVRGVFGGAA
jgi:hypothetical protein